MENKRVLRVLGMNTDKLSSSLQKIPFEIISIVLYGSWAKKKADKDSDIDLLIVAEGINHRKNKRGKEIVSIKKEFSLEAPLDILLLTPHECISNFKNHNPLFLDISEEGVILFDKGDFIASLMRETKKYIYERKIEKLEDGWRFPISAHSFSYLSKISQKDFADVMLKDGKRDYQIGEKLKEEGFFDKAVYHLQQAVEKSVKSILICFGVFKKTHFVGEVLLKEIEGVDLEEEWRKRLKEIAIISEEIEPEVTWSRYPGIDQETIWIPYEEYLEEDAKEAAEKALKVVNTAEEFFRYWFRKDLV